MPAGRVGQAIGRTATTLLRARVHAQACVRAPLAYLQAAAWRARGLRLRSRHRFAALMGQAPDAYALWIATREVALHAELRARAAPERPKVWFVVDAREDASGVPDTLRSIDLARRKPGSSSEIDSPVLVLEHFAARDHAQWAAGSATAVDPGMLEAELAKGREAASAAGKRLFVLVVPAGDRLSPLALDAYCTSIAQHPEASLFYADDDLVEAERRRSAPHFKPKWNPELARHHDFVSGSCLFAVGAEPVGDVRAAALVRALREPARHVPFVLHHRRSRPKPIVPPSTPAAVARDEQPHVSIVVPTRNQSALLRTCIEGLERTAYSSFDVTVIDNGSDDPLTLSFLQDLLTRGVQVLRDDGPFNFSALHNRAVPALRGPLLCLLNNDVEILDGHWLSAMMPHALKPDVGAVGAQLLYPDRTIQHAGIVIGIGGGAGHAHRGERAGSEGYFQRASLPQFVSAVTAACLVVEKSKYLAVGGFNEEAFPVAFNDVDLCLRLNAAGFQSFYEPRAALIHHESKSRGFDRRGEGKRRFAGELARLKERWGTDHQVDPFHHPELSRLTERFVVRL